jgi:hypothetical protein
MTREESDLTLQYNGIWTTCCTKSGFDILRICKPAIVGTERLEVFKDLFHWHTRTQGPCGNKRELPFVRAGFKPCAVSFLENAFTGENLDLSGLFWEKLPPNPHDTRTEVVYSLPENERFCGFVRWALGLELKWGMRDALLGIGFGYTFDSIVHFVETYKEKK